MSDREKKIVQYLREAQGMEHTLTSVLASQIAMTPRGSYRDALQSHLRQTREHAKRVRKRLGELDAARNPIEFGVGLVEAALGQAVALGKVPIDLVRGSGGEEKVLKNAKDTAATEALEIATYSALERLARSVGDRPTAELASSIKSDEEAMLQRVLREIPDLTQAVVEAEVNGAPPSGSSRSGATRSGRSRSTARSASRSAGAKRTGAGAKRTGAGAKRTGAGAKRTGAGAKRTGAGAKRAGASAKLRSARTNRIGTAPARAGAAPEPASVPTPERRVEPWPGYEQQNVDEITSTLDRSSDARAQQVRSYERQHKNRSGVIEAAEHELAVSH